MLECSHQMCAFSESDFDVHVEGSHRVYDMSIHLVLNPGTQLISQSRSQLDSEPLVHEQTHDLELLFVRKVG